MRPVDARGPATHAIIVVAIGLVAVQASRMDAHKAITSPYTYNEHVFPILRDRCGACHADGGPTPMSLVTYVSATPWAQSMREQLIWERMPPWYADPSGPVMKGAQALTPRELDVLITWATGGTPEGDVAKRPPPLSPAPQWPAGPPDLLVAMPEPFIVVPNSLEERHSFTLATGLTETRWVKAADLLPGASSMVREALIEVENGPVLATWLPGQDARAMTPPDGAGFKLPAGARLRLHIRYKKNWQDEQRAIADRSTVGLYFTNRPASAMEIQSMTFDGATPPPSTEAQTVTGSVTRAARVLAVRPLLDEPYASVALHAVVPGGRRIPLLRLHAPRQEWPRRYWLADPIEIPQGSTLEMTATPAPPDLDGVPATPRATLRFAVDYVAR